MQAALTRLQTRHLSAAWEAWQGIPQYKAALNAKLASRIAKLMQAQLLSAWNAWRAYTVIRTHRRVVQQQVIRRLQQRVSESQLLLRLYISTQGVRGTAIQSRQSLTAWTS